MADQVLVRDLWHGAIYATWTFRYHLRRFAIWTLRYELFATWTFPQFGNHLPRNVVDQIAFYTIFAARCYA